MGVVFVSGVIIVRGAGIGPDLADYTSFLYPPYVGTISSRKVARQTHMLYSGDEPDELVHPCSILPAQMRVL